jgi:hypothetical protein
MQKLKCRNYNAVRTPTLALITVKVSAIALPDAKERRVAVAPFRRLAPRRGETTDHLCDHRHEGCFDRPA